MKTVRYFIPFRADELDETFTKLNEKILLSDDTWRGQLGLLGANDAVAIEGHCAEGELSLYSRHKNQKPVSISADWVAWLIQISLSEKCQTIIIHACDSLAFGKEFKKHLGPKNTREVWAGNDTIRGHYWDHIKDQIYFTKL